MPQDPFVPQSTSPEGRQAEQLSEILRRLRALEQGSRQEMVVSDGTRVRVWVGYDPTANRYGIRVFDSTGVLVHDYTTAA